MFSCCLRKSKIKGFKNFNFSLIICRSVDCKIPITCIARTIILFWPRFFGHIETEKFLKFLRKTAIFKGLKRQGEFKNWQKDFLRRLNWSFSFAQSNQVWHILQPLRSIRKQNYGVSRTFLNSHLESLFNCGIFAIESVICIF